MRKNNIHRMKAAIAGLTAAAAIGAIGSVAAAQTLPTRFDNTYLDQHPKIGAALSANPALVDDPRFMAEHPGFAHYLSAHPEIRADLRQHPYRFVSHADQSVVPGHEYGPRPMAYTDNYLDRHPDVAQEISRNPKLVDDPAYVANHPGLHEYMLNHPVARAEWKSHPYRFMQREHRYKASHS